MTTEAVLPEVLENVFVAYSKPEDVFAALLPAVCEVLQTDRCFLHLRNPHTRMYQNLCWRRSPQFLDTSTNGWEPEIEWERVDPMFAAALRTDSSIFVEDVERASPEVLNINFERKYLGHRAFIHAHLCQDGLLWAILQPCIFGHPRVWDKFDRYVIHQVLEKLKPFAISYVKNAGV
jgi:GAF domain-containing protein